MGATQLKTSLCTALLLLVPIVGGGDVHAADKPDIYICADTTRNLTGSQRMLVYTYIDGKKTECMEKHDLLVFYAEKTGGTAPTAPKKNPKIEKMKRVVDSLKAEAKEGKNYASQDLRGRDFRGAHLPDANFSGADLRSADLRGATLCRADFTGAKLDAAFLKNADLRGADFTDAALHGTFLNGVNLRGVKGFTMEDVRAVRTLHEAKMDSVFYDEVRFACPDKLTDASWYWHNNEWADWRGKGEKRRWLIGRRKREPKIPPSMIVPDSSAHE